MTHVMEIAFNFEVDRSSNPDGEEICDVEYVNVKLEDGEAIETWITNNSRLYPPDAQFTVVARK